MVYGWDILRYTRGTGVYLGILLYGILGYNTVYHGILTVYHGILVVYWWYTGGILGGYTGGILVVYWWYTGGILVVYWWYTEVY